MQTFLWFAIKTANGTWYLKTPTWGALATDQGSVGDHFAVVWRSFPDDLLLIAESAECFWILGGDQNSEKNTGGEFHINWFIKPPWRIFSLLTKQSLLMIMSCRLFAATIGTMLTYCQLPPKKKLHWSLNQNAVCLLKKWIWKCCLRYGGHFVSASVCKSIHAKADKEIKSGCPCITGIRGTQSCALVGDVARAQP